MNPNSKTTPPSTEVSEPDLDKKGFEHHEENLTVAEEDGGNAAVDRKITRKIDLRLLPLLVLAYTMTFLDRVNIGNARLWNMEDDLGLKGYDFNIVVLGKRRTTFSQTLCSPNNDSFLYSIHHIRGNHCPIHGEAILLTQRFRFLPIWLSQELSPDIGFLG